MTTINKVRNEIRFIREDGKYWAIDVNNGNIIGYKGGTVKSMPKGGKQDLEAYIARENTVEAQLLYLIAHKSAKAYISFVESMLNAGNTHFNSRRGCYSAEWFERHCDKQMCRHLVSFAHSNIEPQNKTYTFSELFAAYEEAQFCKKYAKLIEKYSLEEVQLAARYFEEVKDIKMYLYYTNDEMAKTLVENGWINSRTLHDRAKDIIRWCKRYGNRTAQGFNFEANILLLKTTMPLGNIAHKMKFLQRRKTLILLFPLMVTRRLSRKLLRNV